MKLRPIIKLFSILLIIFVLLVGGGLIYINRVDFRLDPARMGALFKGSTSPKLNALNWEGRKLSYAFLNGPSNSKVVFIHGSPGSWDAYISYFKRPELIGNHMLLSVDRAGFGYHDAGLTEVSLALQAKAVADIIRQHPSEKTIVVGHSLGGAVAARLAMDYPELVQGMLLAASSVDPALEPVEWFRPFLLGSLAQALLPDPLLVCNEEIYYLKGELEQMLGRWKNLLMPVLVIQGTDDGLVAPENLDFVQRNISPACFQGWWLEGAGHFVLWEHEDKIVEGIEFLLARIGD